MAQIGVITLLVIVECFLFFYLFFYVTHTCHKIIRYILTYIINIYNT